MSKCILCDKEGTPIVRNDLEMFKCPACNLVWRRTFDIPLAHYEGKEIDLSPEKVKDRIKNCKDRVRTFSRYVDLNNLCDIGCGEGIFLKVADDLGYTNLSGVEPSHNISSFAKENNLKIYKGTVDDVCTITKSRDIHVFTMFHLIEHLQNPLLVLRNLNQCMAEGDHLIVETPDIDSPIFKASGYKHKLVYPEHLFYFNKKNLRKIFEMSGYKVVASGKRDFNQWNMSIKNALQKFGLMSIRSDSVKSDSLHKNGEPLQAVIESSSQSTRFVKNIVRKILSVFVVLFNRTDYQWVVAEKRMSHSQYR